MNARLIRLSWFWVGFMTVLCSAATAREQLSVSPVSKQLDKPLAELRNERVKISFVTCERQGKSSVTPVFQVRTKDGWHRVAADASAESYQVLQADPDLKMDLYHVMHPKWKAVKALKLKGGITKVVWNAGENHEAIVKSAKQDGPNRVVSQFSPAEGRSVAGHLGARAGRSLGQGGTEVHSHASGAVFVRLFHAEP